MRVLIICSTFFYLTTSYAVEADAEKLHAIGKTVLKEIATTNSIVNAVKLQNSKGLKLDDIKRINEKWVKTSGQDDFVKSLMNNECAKALQNAAGEHPYIIEAIVMDQLGSNVCMLNKSSDYWQGDEEKFVKAFADSKGAIFVDKIRFDVSTQAYIAQVSLPIMDGAKAIGAITFGLNAENIK